MRVGLRVALPAATPRRLAGATFASLAGVDLPRNDRDGQPIIFDSYDITPVMTVAVRTQGRTGSTSPRTGSARARCGVGKFKYVFNLRGDNGAQTGGLAVDSNLGWKDAESYVATVPQVFDLLADPQGRYDIFTNNFTEHT